MEGIVYNQTSLQRNYEGDGVDMEEPIMGGASQSV